MPGKTTPVYTLCTTYNRMMYIEETGNILVTGSESVGHDLEYPIFDCDFIESPVADIDWRAIEAFQCVTAANAVYKWSVAVVWVTFEYRFSLCSVFMLSDNLYRSAGLCAGQYHLPWTPVLCEEDTNLTFPWLIPGTSETLTV